MYVQYVPYVPPQCLHIHMQKVMCVEGPHTLNAHFYFNMATFMAEWLRVDNTCSIMWTLCNFKKVITLIILIQEPPYLKLLPRPLISFN